MIIDGKYCHNVLFCYEINLKKIVKIQLHVYSVNK